MKFEDYWEAMPDEIVSSEYAEEWLRFMFLVSKEYPYLSAVAERSLEAASHYYSGGCEDPRILLAAVDECRPYITFYPPMLSEDVDRDRLKRWLDYTSRHGLDWEEAERNSGWSRHDSEELARYYSVRGVFCLLRSRSSYIAEFEETIEYFTDFMIAMGVAEELEPGWDAFCVRTLLSCLPIEGTPPNLTVRH